MNVANCRHLVAVFVYCGVAVLMIVNGQSTTDHDIDRDEISLIDMIDMLTEEMAELRAEQSKSAHTINSLKSELAVSNDKIAQLENKGKRKGIRVGYIKCARYSLLLLEINSL